MDSALRLSFAAPRLQDRLLGLQLGKVAIEGVTLERVDAGTDADLVEVPLHRLLHDHDLTGLPVFPHRDEEGDGPLALRSVIALRREIHERDPGLVARLLDGFETSRAVAWKRLRLLTSPALAMPWLVDQAAADEERFGGDPFPVGMEPNLEALAEAAAAFGIGADDLLARFAPAGRDHEPAETGESVEPPPPPVAGDLPTCRGLAYVDRSLRLEDGSVGAGSVAYIAAPSLGGAAAAVTSGEVDVAEILLGDLLAEIADGERRILGLPVFPARRFVQRCFFVAADSGLDSVAGLDGLRIGYPPGGATAAVWAVDLLAQAGAKAEFRPAPLGGALGRMLDRGREGTTLGELLAAGEIDGLVTPYALPPADGGDRLRPLLADPATSEREQAGRLGPPPISNVLAMNRVAYERDPARAGAVCAAFAEARTLGRAGLLAPDPTVALPRLAERLEEAECACGGDPYPYGLAANRDALARFVGSAVKIGAVTGDIAVDDLFAPGLA